MTMTEKHYSLSNFLEKLDITTKELVKTELKNSGNASKESLFDALLTYTELDKIWGLMSYNDLALLIDPKLYSGTTEDSNNTKRAKMRDSVHISIPHNWLLKLKSVERILFSMYYLDTFEGGELVSFKTEKSDHLKYLGMVREFRNQIINKEIKEIDIERRGKMTTDSFDAMMVIVNAYGRIDREILQRTKDVKDYVDIEFDAGDFYQSERVTTFLAGDFEFNHRSNQGLNGSSYDYDLSIFDGIKTGEMEGFEQREHKGTAIKDIKRLTNWDNEGISQRSIGGAFDPTNEKALPEQIQEKLTESINVLKSGKTKTVSKYLKNNRTSLGVTNVLESTAILKHVNFNLVGHDYEAIVAKSNELGGINHRELFLQSASRLHAAKYAPMIGNRNIFMDINHKYTPSSSIVYGEQIRFVDDFKHGKDDKVVLSNQNLRNHLREIKGMVYNKFVEMFADELTFNEMLSCMIYFHRLDMLEMTSLNLISQADYPFFNIDTGSLTFGEYFKEKKMSSSMYKLLNTLTSKFTKRDAFLDIDTTMYATCSRKYYSTMLASYKQTLHKCRELFVVFNGGFEGEKRHVAYNYIKCPYMNPKLGYAMRNGKFLARGSELADSFLMFTSPIGFNKNFRVVSPTYYFDIQIDDSKGRRLVYNTDVDNTRIVKLETAINNAPAHKQGVGHVPSHNNYTNWNGCKILDLDFKSCDAILAIRDKYAADDDFCKEHGFDNAVDIASYMMVGICRELNKSLSGEDSFVCARPSKSFTGVHVYIAANPYSIKHFNDKQQTLNEFINIRSQMAFMTKFMFVLNDFFSEMLGEELLESGDVIDTSTVKIEQGVALSSYRRLDTDKFECDFFINENFIPVFPCYNLHKYDKFGGKTANEYLEKESYSASLAKVTSKYNFILFDGRGHERFSANSIFVNTFDKTSKSENIITKVNTNSSSFVTTKEEREKIINKASYTGVKLVEKNLGILVEAHPDGNVPDMYLTKKGKRISQAGKDDSKKCAKKIGKVLYRQQLAHHLVAMCGYDYDGLRLAYQYMAAYVLGDIETPVTTKKYGSECKVSYITSERGQKRPFTEDEVANIILSAKHTIMNQIDAEDKHGNKKMRMPHKGAKGAYIAGFSGFIGLDKAFTAWKNRLNKLEKATEKMLKTETVSDVNTYNIVSYGFRVTPSGISKNPVTPRHDIRDFTSTISVSDDEGGGVLMSDIFGELHEKLEEFKNDNPLTHRKVDQKFTLNVDSVKALGEFEGVYKGVDGLKRIITTKNGDERVYLSCISDVIDEYLVDDKINYLNAPPAVGKTEWVKTLNKIRTKPILVAVPYISVLESKFGKDFKAIKDDDGQSAFLIFDSDSPKSLGATYNTGFDGRQQETPSKSIVCTTNQLEQLDSELFSCFSTIIIDEAHLLTTETYRKNMCGSLLDKCVDYKKGIVKKSTDRIDMSLLSSVGLPSLEEDVQAQIVFMSGTPAFEYDVWCTKNEAEGGNILKTIEIEKQHDYGKEIDCILLRAENAQYEFISALYSHLDDGKTVIFPTNKGDKFLEKLISIVSDYNAVNLDNPKTYNYYCKDSSEELKAKINAGTLKDIDVLACTTYLSVGVDLKEHVDNVIYMYYGYEHNYNSIEQYNNRVRTAKLRAELYLPIITKTPPKTVDEQKEDVTFNELETPTYFIHPKVFNTLEYDMSVYAENIRTFNRTAAAKEDQMRALAIKNSEAGNVLTDVNTHFDEDGVEKEGKLLVNMHSHYNKVTTMFDEMLKGFVKFGYDVNLTLRDTFLANDITLDEDGNCVEVEKKTKPQKLAYLDNLNEFEIKVERDKNTTKALKEGFEKSFKTFLYNPNHTDFWSAMLDNQVIFFQSNNPNYEQGKVFSGSKEELQAVLQKLRKDTWFDSNQNQRKSLFSVVNGYFSLSVKYLYVVSSDYAAALKTKCKTVKRIANVSGSTKADDSSIDPNVAFYIYNAVHSEYNHASKKEIFKGLNTRKLKAQETLSEIITLSVQNELAGKMFNDYMTKLKANNSDLLSGQRTKMSLREYEAIKNDFYVVIKDLVQKDAELKELRNGELFNDEKRNDKVEKSTKKKIDALFMPYKRGEVVTIGVPKQPRSNNTDFNQGFLFDNYLKHEDKDLHPMEELFTISSKDGADLLDDKRDLKLPTEDELKQINEDKQSKLEVLELIRSTNYGKPVEKETESKITKATDKITHTPKPDKGDKTREFEKIMNGFNAADDEFFKIDE